MKAIVINLLAGSFCLVMISPALAEVVAPNQELDLSATIWSVKTFGNDNPWLLPEITNFEAQTSNYVIFVEKPEYLPNIIRQDNWLFNQEIPSLEIKILDYQLLSLSKKPYLYRYENQDIILGLHNNFWSRENKQKYYGLTTIEQWGHSSTPHPSLKKLNYLDSAPKLSQGTSALTLSGGGRKNLIQQNHLLTGFTDFRGGVTFHQGLAENLTWGAGFIYEDSLLSSFSQFTYQPRNFPLQTTLSLINNQQKLSLYSHLQFKPIKTFIIDFYGNQAQQKFAFNWQISPGLNLSATVDRDSQANNLRSGGVFAFKNNFWSLLAQAEISKNNRIKWQFASQIGRLRLTYKASAVKTHSQIDYALGNFNNQDWQSSLFMRNQTSLSDKSLENLAIWGWHFHSNSPLTFLGQDSLSPYSNRKIDSKNYLWQFDLGYGIGSQGQGVIISAATVVKSGLSLKLSYESISLASNESKISLKLTSIQ